MKDIDIINIDYSAKNPEYNRKETYLIKDLPGNIVVPNEGPFYVKGLVVKAGSIPLTINKDFKVENELTDLELKLGKKTALYISLSDKVMNDNKEIIINYQKVGDGVINIEYLFSLMEQLLDPTKTYDWEKDIIGKPSTFPSAYHQHDITSAIEVVGFGGLITLFIQANNMQKKYGLQVHNRLQQMKENFTNRLNLIYQTRWEQIMSHINRVDVPHPMTKETLGLGKHPNYHTATVDEDKAGEREDLLSTPAGLKAAIEKYNVESDDYLKQGELPLSYFGTGIYIPPSISGSFEGLGSSGAKSGFCLESNGWMVMLARGFDSKVKNLYFFTNKNFSTSGEQVYVNSGYQYTHPTITAAGCNANTILSGSGPKIIVLGDQDKGRYWISLSGGTFSPVAHNLKEINMESLTTPSGTKFNLINLLSFFIMGDWVFCWGLQNGWNKEVPEENRIGDSSQVTSSLFKFPLSELSNPSVDLIEFRHQYLNYQDVKGNWKYNQEYYNVVLRERADLPDTTGKVRNILANDICDFSNGMNSVQRRWVNNFYGMTDPSNRNKGKIRYFWNMATNYNDGNLSNYRDTYGCIPYNFDITTNTMSLDPRFVRRSMDSYTMKFIVDGVTTDTDEWFNNRLSNLTSGHNEICRVWLDNIGFMVCSSNASSFPWYVKRIVPNHDDLMDNYKLFDSTYEDISLTTARFRLDSPFPFSTNICGYSNVYEVDGSIRQNPIELFIGQDKNLNIRKYYKVSTSRDFVEDPRLVVPYIDRKILSRKQSADYGECIIERSGSTSYNIPTINYSKPGSRWSIQYGINSVYALGANVQPPFSSKTLYEDSRSLDTNSDLYIPTLGVHTLDDINKKLTISPHPDWVFKLPKSQYLGLLKTLMGDMGPGAFDEQTGTPIEYKYLFSIGLVLDPDEKVQPYCTAMAVWHSYKPNSTAKNQSYLSSCIFKIKDNGKGSDGFRTLDIVNIEYPLEKYSPAGDRKARSDFLVNSNGDWGVSGRNGVADIMGAARLEYVYKRKAEGENLRMWFTNSYHINHPGWNAAFWSETVKTDGDFTDSKMGSNNLSSVPGLANNKTAFLEKYDLAQYLPFVNSGGAGCYVSSNTLGDEYYALLGTVFMDGQWSIFINAELDAVFNGSVKKLPLSNFDLSTLGLNPKNKVFYLYAVSGKAEGYYELTLIEKTTSPYHMLAAVITTNDLGITKIEVDQGLYIAGFKISTDRAGGIVPAAIGTPLERGSFKAISDIDIFDKSKYSS